MSRAAIYQLFRRIPDADEAAVDAAIDALEDQGATKQRAETRADIAELRAEQVRIKEQMATKSDIVELRTEMQADMAEMRASFRLVHWMIGIMGALLAGMFWMLFGIVDRLSAMETRLSAIETTMRAFGG